MRVLWAKQVFFYCYYESADNVRDLSVSASCCLNLSFHQNHQTAVFEAFAPFHVIFNNSLSKVIFKLKLISIRNLLFIINYIHNLISLFAHHSIAFKMFKLYHQNHSKFFKSRRIKADLWKIWRSREFIQN